MEKKLVYSVMGVIDFAILANKKLSTRRNKANILLLFLAEVMSSHLKLVSKA